MRIWCGWHRVAAKFLVKFRSCWVVCDEISEKGSYFPCAIQLNIPVPVVVEKLCSSHYVVLGDQNKPGGVAQGEHLCDAVRGDLAVIEQTPKTSTFACSINTENVTEINI